MAPRRSWAKANNPFWSKHVVAWYQGALETEHYCRKRDLSTTSLMRLGAYLLGAANLRKRAKHLRNLPQKVSKRQQNKEPSKRQRRPRRYRYGVRTDSGPIALQAFWRMHIEAINIQRYGACRICRGIRSVAAFAAHLARPPGTIQQRNGLTKPASSECPGAIEQRC
jgi:hypothetical protein